ncbi:MAG: hypothetical protein LBD92_07395 [Oscillospiraceae bacterium]|jgi:hypothetical protein|nr:hypothetical protein [Oscillospiraceae bacterium]
MKTITTERFLELLPDENQVFIGIDGEIYPTEQLEKVKESDQKEWSALEILEFGEAIDLLGGDLLWAITHTGLIEEKTLRDFSHAVAAWAINELKTGERKRKTELKDKLKDKDEDIEDIEENARIADAALSAVYTADSAALTVARTLQKWSVEYAYSVLLGMLRDLLVKEA